MVLEWLISHKRRFRCRKLLHSRELTWTMAELHLRVVVTRKSRKIPVYPSLASDIISPLICYRWPCFLYRGNCFVSLFLIFLMFFLVGFPPPRITGSVPRRGGFVPFGVVWTWGMEKRDSKYEFRVWNISEKFYWPVRNIYSLKYLPSSPARFFFGALKRARGLFPGAWAMFPLRWKKGKSEADLKLQLNKKK